MFCCAQLPIVHEAPEDVEVLASWEDDDGTPSPAASHADNSCPPEPSTGTNGPAAGASAASGSGKKRASSCGMEQLMALYRDKSREAAAATESAHTLQKKLVKLHTHANRTQDRIADMMASYFASISNKE